MMDNRPLSAPTPPVGALVELIPYFSVLILFLVAVYFPTVIFNYASGDDYVALKAGQAGSAELFKHCILSGRPVYAVFNEVYRYVDTFLELRLIRAMGIMGLSGICCMCLWYLRYCGVDPVESLLMACSIGLIPGFQLIPAWATTSPFSLAYMASALAAIITAESVLKEQHSTASTVVFVSLGTLFMIFSFCFYQPAAMFFWVFALIPFLADRITLKTLPRFIGAFGLVFAISSLCGFLVVKVLPGLLYSDLTSMPRTQLIDNVGEKYDWFLNEPLFNAFNLFEVREPLISTVQLVLFFAVVGIVLKRRSSIPWKVIILLIAACAILLSYVPNLVVRENWASYRSIVSMTSMVVLFLSFSIKWIFEFLSLNNRYILRYGPRLFLAVILGIGLYKASYNVNRVIIYTQMTEYAFLKQNLNRVDLSSVSSIEVKRSRWDDSVAPYVRYDEFGLPSSSAAWSLEPMVFQALRDSGRNPADLPVTILKPDDESQPAPDALFIDMGGLRNLK
ncbi:MAG: hypothetical protein ACLGPL_05305 [Acidobacteriota bacterium]